MLERCHWPPLAPPYDVALRAAVAFVFVELDPVGIIASGTIVRGNPAPTSDLDLFVIRRRPERQRLQRFFHGVPAEIFVNPPERVERYFESERIDGRPSTAHMIATGFVVYDADPVIAQIRTRANEVLASGPTVDEASLVQRRYAVATTLEDALDIVDVDPEMCAAILHVAVDGAARYRFVKERRWQPRNKELLTALDGLDAELATLVRQFYQASRLEDRIALARTIVERTMGATGFFEWESEPSP